MIEREKVLANNLLIGDKDSPTYSYKNRNLRSGSLKGSFSLDPIVNELAVDTFQFTVHYDPDAQRFAYSPVDMGNGVYRCNLDGTERDLPGTLESCGWISEIVQPITQGTTTVDGKSINITGGTNGGVTIAPPDRHSRSVKFYAGDVIKIKISADMSGESSRIRVMPRRRSNYVTVESETGYFRIVTTVDTHNVIAIASVVSGSLPQGEDVITIIYTADCDQALFISGDDVTTITVDKIEFNGDVIYGKPNVGKVYLCRPTNPIPLDKYLTDVPYGTPVWWMCEES